MKAKEFRVYSNSPWSVGGNVPQRKSFPAIQEELAKQEFRRLWKEKKVPPTVGYVRLDGHEVHMRESEAQAWALGS